MGPIAEASGTSGAQQLSHGTRQRVHEIQDAERSTSAHTIGRDPVHQHSEASRVSRAKARGEQGPDDPREGVARASSAEPGGRVGTHPHWLLERRRSDDEGVGTLEDDVRVEEVGRLLSGSHRIRLDIIASAGHAPSSEQGGQLTRVRREDRHTGSASFIQCEGARVHDRR